MGYANRKINLNIKSTKFFNLYHIGTTGYHILKHKNINIDLIKEKYLKINN